MVTEGRLECSEAVLGTDGRLLRLLQGLDEGETYTDEELTEYEKELDDDDDDDEEHHAQPGEVNVRTALSSPSLSSSIDNWHSTV